LRPIARNEDLHTTHLNFIFFGVDVETEAEGDEGVDVEAEAEGDEETTCALVKLAVT